MTAAWAHTLRDLSRQPARAALIVLSISTGLAGFFAVLSADAVLRRELNAGYMATNPPSAVLTTDAIGDRLVAAVVARGDVEDADARRVLRGRIRTPSGQWRRLVLFVIRDIDRLRIGAVTRERGAEALRPGDLLIERDAFQVAQAQPGDLVEIELKQGERRTLRIAGGVHDLGQAQARMENMVYGYITPATLPRLGEAATLDRLYLSVSGDRFDGSHVRRVADQVKAWLEANGHPVTRVNVPPPGEHPHAAIMDLLLLTMAAFGGVVVLLGGIIAASLFVATLAAQRRQIGVMKAIGGSRLQIARIYLVQAAVLGFAAIALALPAGRAAGGALTAYLAVLLNVDVTSGAIPAWTYLLVAVVGLAVPLAAAAYPIAAATRVTVRAALDDAGVNRAMVASIPIAAAFARIGGPARPWLLGMRNSVRRPGRTALALATLTVSGASFMAALNVRASMMALLDAMFGDGTFGSDERYALDQHMLMIYAFLLIVAAVLGLVGALGMTTATSLNVLDRRREFGVLRTIGASPAMVRLTVMVEAVAIASLSWLLAIALAWPMSAALGRLLTAALFRRPVTVAVSVTGVAAWLGISVIVAGLSSVVPASAASRRSIREAVSYE